MRALFLSLAAVCALLGDASPVDKRQPGLINGDVSQVSTTSTGLAKRLSVIEGNTVTINGVVVPPGTELAGGIFIEGPNTPICYAYCLNPRLPVSPVNYRAKCAAQGCPNSTINPNAIYVLEDGQASYKGDRLKPCQDGKVCADIRRVLINFNQYDYPA